MKQRKYTIAILGMAAACCLGLLMILAVGCEKQDEKPTPAETTQEQQAVQVANVRCPMMGTAINPAKVPEGLTRAHNGKKVGFCCASCLEGWDKLSDAEKDAKLAETMPEKGD